MTNQKNVCVTWETIFYLNRVGYTDRMTALMMTILEENKELFAVSTEQSIVINTHKKTKKKYITLFITQFTIAK